MLNVSLQQPCQIWIEIWSSLGRPSCEWFCSLPLWQSTWKLQLRPHRSWFPHPYVSNNPQSHGFYLFFCLFFVDVTLFFSSFLLVLSGTFDPKKQNTNRHVSRSMSPKLSAPHSISPWRLRWLFQMRNIWNLRSKPQDLRSKPHQINGNLQTGGFNTKVEFPQGEGMGGHRSKWWASKLASSPIPFGAVFRWSMLNFGRVRQWMARRFWEARDLK